LLRYVFVLVAVTVAPATHAIEAHLPRHPAPSPDGASIVFSWQGDLWSVAAEGGQGRRLTVHPGADRHPIWSRDGSTIAFASNRHGSFDIHVMPADASAPPRRLTHASVADVPVDFTVDGSQVLFTSRRLDSPRRTPGLHLVPVDGGTPWLAIGALARNASYSPDGRTLALVRGTSRWTRHGYRGSGSRDIWLYTINGDYILLSDFVGDDDVPQWIGHDRLLILSERAGRKNLFRLDVRTRAATQLTHHPGSDVRSPRLSADGRLVAYEFEDAIWTVSTDGGRPHRVTIEVPADAAMNPTERKLETNGATELAVRPDSEMMALVVAGDVWVAPIVTKEEQEVAKPRTVRVTATAGRERDVSWSPDGRWLVFASDRAGSLDIYRARPADDADWRDAFRFDVERLTEHAGEEHSPRWSPDGTRIAYVRDRGDLVTIAADGTDPHVVLEHWDSPDYDWSPDGRYLAYAVNDMEFNSEIWIAPAAGGEPYNVSRHPDNDRQPRFSPDGRRLVWVSLRHGATADVWAVWLRREDHERTPADWLQVWAAEKDRGKSKGSSKSTDKKRRRKSTADDDATDVAATDEDEKEAETKPVVIDFHLLHGRARWRARPLLGPVRR